MIGFIKRYRELIAIGALLLLPLITYLAYAKRDKGRPLNRFDRAVIWVSTPIERLVTGVGFGVIDTWNGYVSLRHVREENLSLRRQVLKLEEASAQNEETRAENERLRRDLSYVASAPMRPVAASVIGWSPTPEYLSFTIGKGSADGLEVGMAVATPEGLVGRIQQIASKTAWVILIGDPKFVIPVRDQRSRSRATVRGRGERQACQLTRLPRQEKVEEGDILVTEGVEVFPKGLVVGKVHNVIQPRYGLFQVADVTPAVDVSKLEEVLVLTQPAPEPAEARSVTP